MKENSTATPVPAVPTDANRHIPRGVTDGDTILATVDVTMPPERVFRALSTDEVERWWGSPETYRIRNWTAEVRVGGQWKLNVCLPDGNVLPAGGEFTEISEPNKIVHTRRYDFDYPILGRRVTTVTYRLDPIAAGTRVTVRHDGFAGLRQSADEHVVVPWGAPFHWCSRRNSPAG